MVDTEGLKRKYAPEGSALRDLQMKMLQEVLCLDRICKENHLTYFLTGGSALGAIRHHGFIPWDDDMDIALPKKDYLKLIGILHKLDSEQYVLHDRFSDFNYVNGFPKFREKEGDLLGSLPERGKLYKYKGVGVDIFCIDNNSFIRSFVCAKLRVALLHYTYLIKNDKLREAVTKFQWLVYQCLIPLTWPLNVFRKKGEMHYGLGQSFAKHYMWESEVFPVAEVDFEMAKLPVPHDGDAFLTNIYGNWRQVPEEEEIMKNIHNVKLISK
jgi:lipopolysaccharide cholinephosphotransferase